MSSRSTSAGARKSKRPTTVAKNKELKAKVDQYEKDKRGAAKRPQTPVVKLTQAERLRQAVETERENTMSLLRLFYSTKIMSRLHS